MKKMTPERFDFICDTLYGMVRKAQKLAYKEIGFEVKKYSCENLGWYAGCTIIIYEEELKRYHICELLSDDAEDIFEKAKKCLNEILSEAYIQTGKAE